VAAKGLNEVQRLLSSETGEIEVVLGEREVVFRVGTTEVTTRLIEGEFPNYEQVIPKNNPKTLTVARVALREALDRVATHSDNITHQVKFAVAPDAVRLSVNTADVGAGEESLEATYDGDELEVGYNANYLLDILRTIETENVLFRLNTSISAGIVEPAGALSDGSEEVLCLIMPLRLPEPAAV
jgi:DNA polymerase-3 subunit beta